MNKIRFVILVCAFLGISLGLKAQTQDTLSDFGDFWKYADKTKLDSIDWKASSYNDGSWNCGPAPLGYGDAWMATCISCGCATEYNCSHPSTCSVNTTDYFRKKITVSDVKKYDSVKIEGIIDDGLVLYVNGNQSWLYGLTAPVTYSSWSSNNISGAAETNIVNTVISIDAFVNGDNQISAELHQRAANTSDATFDLRFIFFKHQAPSSGIDLLTSGKNLKIYPNPSNGDFTIEGQSNINGMFEISYYDVTGRVALKEIQSFHDGRANLHPILTNGTYIARVKSDKINSTFTLHINN